MAPLTPAASTPAQNPLGSLNKKKVEIGETKQEFDTRLTNYKQIRSGLSPQGQVLANILTDLDGKTLPSPTEIIEMYKKAAVGYGVKSGSMNPNDAKLISQMVKQGLRGTSGWNQSTLDAVLAQAPSVVTEKSDKEKQYDQNVATFLKDTEQYKGDEQKYQEKVAEFKKQNEAYLSSLLEYSKNPMKDIPAPIVGGTRVTVPIIKSLTNKAEVSLIGSAPLNDAGLRLQASLSKDEDGKTSGTVRVSGQQKPDTFAGGTPFFDAGFATAIPVFRDKKRDVASTPRDQVNRTTGAGDNVTTTDGVETGREAVAGSTTSSIENGTPTTTSSSNLSVSTQPGLIAKGGMKWGSFQRTNTNGVGAELSANLGIVPSAGIGVSAEGVVGYRQNVGTVFGLPARVSALATLNQRLTGPDEGRTGATLAAMFSAGGGAPTGTAHPLTPDQLVDLERVQAERLQQ